MSELIDTMMAKYSTYGNAYTLFAAAASQFPSYYRACLSDWVSDVA
jgi:hypothetical protein